MWLDAEAALLWVDILGQRLHRLDTATGRCRTWHFDETISALAECADGPGLIVALQRDIAWFDPDTGVLERLHAPEPHWPGNRFNDGKCDAHGRFWVGSMDASGAQPSGALYVMEHADDELGSRRGNAPATQVRCAWDAGFPVINGPSWSADGRTLWLNDTVHRTVHAATFDPATGSLSAPRRWLTFEPHDGHPDGMTTDSDGRLWIAHWGGGCVTCHAPDSGRELARIALPTANVTSVAFGGPDRRTLYVTTATTELDAAALATQPLAGAVFAVETDATGGPVHRFGQAAAASPSSA